MCVRAVIKGLELWYDLFECGKEALGSPDNTHIVKVDDKHTVLLLLLLLFLLLLLSLLLQTEVHIVATGLKLKADRPSPYSLIQRLMAMVRGQASQVKRHKTHVTHHKSKFANKSRVKFDMHHVPTCSVSKPFSEMSNMA